MNEQLIASSSLAWITFNRLVNENQEPIEFNDHRFMIDFYADSADDIVAKKSAQVGFSVAAILKSIHEAKYERRNIAYILPTQNVVDDFVKPKVNPIITSNPVIARAVHDDSISLKNVANRFIYFKGAFSQSGAVSFSVDTLVLDEYDLMPNQTVVNTFNSRLQAAKSPRRRRFSNPSGVGRGVDRLYQESNQYHWIVTCSHCGYRSYLEFAKEQAWETRGTPVYTHYVDQDKEIYACGGCDQELYNDDRRMGQWIAKYPKVERHGYWFSQLMAPWVSAKQILTQKNESSIEFFYNFVLGKAYTPSEVLVSRETILRANAPGRPTLSQVCIGVDNGILKHYVIGSPNGIFKYGKTESWEEIEALLLTYNAVMVIDANPYPTMPKKLAEKYPGKVFIHYYSQDRKGIGITRWGEGKDRGVVLSDRTKLLDMVAGEINEAKEIYVQPPMELEEMIYHWTNMYRTVEENAQGISQGKWITYEGKPDHLAHCLSGDSLITTNQGLKPLRTIALGDQVLTRKGYKPVEDLVCESENEVVYKVYFSNGQSLKATLSHKFFTSEGWKMLRDITTSDILVSIWSNISKESDTNCTRENDILLAPALVSECISQSGSTITEQFHKAITSTIKTITRLIMRLVILNLNWLSSILENTLFPGHFLSDPVWSAASQFSELTMAKTNTVQENVGLLLPIKSTTKLKEIALYVERGLQPIPILEAKLVQNPVQILRLVKQKKRETVYNITVKDCHEYFANGILVSNSQAYWRVALSKVLVGGLGRILVPTAPEAKAYSPTFDIGKSVKAAKRNENVEYE